MLFSSLRYFAFLASLGLALNLCRSRTLALGLLGVASCLFYAAWDWHYLFLLLTVSVVDYWAASVIFNTSEQRTKRFALTASVVSNLSILAYFKYANFGISNLNLVLDLFGAAHLPVLKILLPAGISFYTFKAMSYTIDVYRGHIEPCKSWMNYLTFITFFPELIAGPIVRASVFLPQLTKKPGVSMESLRIGSQIFLQGLVKKKLIADRLSGAADDIFANPDIFSSGTVWWGLIAYSMQIYCDFSGYSDMAIGSARILGYELPENFRMPYSSTSITEFWRRWHMTLSSWLRDYLYIPLGGNRFGTFRTYINLMLTMLIGGLWHGASWNFVLWGGIHGVSLAIHKFWTSRLRWRMWAVPSWLLTLLVACLAWVPFRAASWTLSLQIFRKLFFLGGDGLSWTLFWPQFLVGFVIAAHLLGQLLEQRANPRFRSLAEKICDWADCELTAGGMGEYLVFKKVSPLALFVWLTLAGLVLHYGPITMDPFIYFQF